MEYLLYFLKVILPKFQYFDDHIDKIQQPSKTIISQMEIMKFLLLRKHLVRGFMFLSKPLKQMQVFRNQVRVLFSLKFLKVHSKHSLWRLPLNQISVIISPLFINFSKKC